MDPNLPFETLDSIRPLENGYQTMINVSYLGRYQTNIPRSKQAWLVIINETVWSLTDVHAHSDELTMGCDFSKDGHKTCYQETFREAIMTLRLLITFIIPPLSFLKEAFYR